MILIMNESRAKDLVLVDGRNERGRGVTKLTRINTSGVGTNDDLTGRGLYNKKNFFIFPVIGRKNKLREYVFV